LVSRGIASERIVIDGRGAYSPIVPNNSPENRAKNRRIEVYMFEPQPQQQLP